MTILQEFQQALQTVLNAYPAEKQSGKKEISSQRTADVMRLQTILAESNQDNKKNAVLLRKALMDFLNGLRVHPLAHFLPSLFGSQLYQKISAVLNQPEYHESTLIARELAENKQRQEKILGYLSIGDTGKLIATIENLEAQLKIKEKQCANLTAQCQTLQGDKTDLTTENQRLLDENKKLREQLGTQETKSSEANNPPRKPLI